MEFGEPTMQADNKLGEYPDAGLVNIFKSGEMDAYLCVELALVDRRAEPAAMPVSISPLPPEPIAGDTFTRMSCL